ncbi:MAG: nucleotidyltransferase [Candidatus Aminicenantes bacterium]|nr:nucleotidyltransferase [Candidatus Aminicenantes bacterium]
MKLEKDYEEFLGLLNRHEVRYCIAGAFAVAFYAKPRYTKDIDILIEPTAANSRRILKALEEFGFGELSLSQQDLTTEGNVIQLGFEPLRIDLLTKLEGFQFRDIWNNRTSGTYGAEKVHFISLEDLIKNKKQAGRPTDLVDVDLLEKARK